MENGPSFSSFEAFDMKGKNDLMLRSSLKKLFCLEEGFCSLSSFLMSFNATFARFLNDFFQMRK